MQEEFCHVPQEEETDEFMKYVEIVRDWFNAEDLDIEVSDLVIGRMASRIRSLILSECEKAHKSGQEEADWWGEKLEDAIESGKKQERSRIIELVEGMIEQDAGSNSILSTLIQEIKK
jgi:hypothetical protein